MERCGSAGRAKQREVFIMYDCAHPRVAAGMYENSEPNSEYIQNRMTQMIKPIVKDIFFLGQKSEPASKKDLSVGQDLMDTLFEIKLYDNNLTYDVPMLFVSGDCDYVCNYTLAQQYCEDISAPAKEFVLMEGCGHAPQYAMPDEFGENVKSFLSGVLVSSEG